MWTLYGTAFLWTSFDAIRSFFYSSHLFDVAQTNLSVFFFSIIFYRSSISRKLTTSFYFFTVAILLDISLAVVMNIFSLEPSVANLWVQFFLLIITQILKAYLTAKGKEDLNSTYGYVTICIALTSFFILAGTSIMNDHQINSMYVFLLMGIIFLILLLFSLLDKVKAASNLKNQNLALKYQIDSYNQNQFIYENYLMEIRGFKHDYKNHLISLRELALQENSPKVVEYITQLSSASFEGSTSLLSSSGHISIDSLINSKYTLAKKFDIKMNLTLEIPGELPFPDVDLTIILGNLLDNAIEAAQQVTATKRYIHLFIRLKQNNLIIEIENTFQGDRLRNKQGNLLTTKADTRNHGMGLNLIKKTVKSYDGLFDIIIEEGMFTVKILLYS